MVNLFSKSAVQVIINKNTFSIYRLDLTRHSIYNKNTFSLYRLDLTRHSIYNKNTFSLYRLDLTRHSIYNKNTFNLYRLDLPETLFTIKTHSAFIDLTYQTLYLLY